MAALPNYDDSDPLSGMPPQPSLRNASPLSKSAPSGSGALPGSVDLTGTGNIQSIMMKMKKFEDDVHQLVQALPGLANVAEQFVTQMRSMGAAALASQAEGGLGSAADSGTPAPMAGGGPGPGAGAPPMMPPPPPPM